MPPAGGKPAESLVRRHETVPAVVFFRDKAGSSKEGRQPFRICGAYGRRESGKQVFQVVPCHGEAGMELHVLLGCCEYPGDGFSP